MDYTSYMENMKYLRRHYHTSPKAGVVYCYSSYELKAAIMLDADDNVAFYEGQQKFTINDRDRFLDFLVSYKDGSKKHIEVKPKKRIDEFKEQIDDNKDYAASKGNLFEIWSEAELGFATEQAAKNWADDYLSSISGIDFKEFRKIQNRKKAKTHYRKVISKDKVTVFCNYCQVEHEVLRINYDKNIAKHGEYWCEKKGGHEAGKTPKKKKVNPYAADGKKQCTLCEEIKNFEQFGLDKSRSDGYATRCLNCRTKIAAERYKRKTKTC